MKGRPRTILIFYAIVIAVALAIVYYANQVYNQPQPLVYFAYNGTVGGGEGYVNNTLPYPIAITSIYCTIPSGAKEVFGSPNNNTLMPDTNTVIDVGVSNKLWHLPENCTGWKVSYDRLPAGTSAPNSPIKVVPT